MANRTFQLEPLRNAGCIVSNCVGLGEVLETVKVIAEGDVRSWYTAWKATAAHCLAIQLDDLILVGIQGDAILDGPDRVDRTHVCPLRAQERVQVQMLGVIQRQSPPEGNGAALAQQDYPN